MGVSSSAEASRQGSPDLIGFLDLEDKGAQDERKHARRDGREHLHQVDERAADVQHRRDALRGRPRGGGGERGGGAGA